MMELLTEKNRDIYLDYFRISKNKFFRTRLLFAFLLLMIFILVVFSTKKYVLFIGIPFVGFLSFKLPYYNLLKRKKYTDMIKTFMFPKFLRCFLSLLETQGNIYQTIKATLPYIEDPIKTEVEKLIEGISQKNEREHYMRFADFIGTGEAHMIMGMIYEFSEHGINKDELQELEGLIDKLQTNKIKELIEYSVSRMDKYANPTIIIMLGFVFAFVVSMFISLGSQVMKHL
ncbi:flagellar assembly protein FlaJ [Margalitia sp. FSL K6-0131]|uniref:flagellar assembly protein FlaJ n=1 Tax=Margalitia sp. FSL K6-0131 TaxID=2954604 RepID=UPI0030F84A03